VRVDMDNIKSCNVLLEPQDHGGGRGVCRRSFVRSKANEAIREIIVKPFWVHDCRCDCGLEFIGETNRSFMYAYGYAAQPIRVHMGRHVKKSPRVGS